MMLILNLLLLHVLLFTVSFGNNNNNDCNSIIFTYPGSNIIIGSPTNQCQIESGTGTSFQYLCDGTGTIINFISYNSTDCSGNPSVIQNNICQLAPDGCIAICNKNDCNGISTISYSNNNCSGDIKAKTNYLPGICIGSSTSAQKYNCFDNGTIQFNQYSSISTNCSGNPISSRMYDPTICTTGSGNGLYLKYAGCESSSTSSTNPPSNSPSNSPSSSSSSSSNSNYICTIFTFIFGAVIIITIS